MERLQHGVDSHSNWSHCGHTGLQSHFVSSWQNVEVRAVGGLSFHRIATFPVLQVKWYLQTSVLHETSFCLKKTLKVVIFLKYISNHNIRQFIYSYIIHEITLHIVHLYDYYTSVKNRSQIQRASCIFMKRHIAWCFFFKFLIRSVFKHLHLHQKERNKEGDKEEDDLVFIGVKALWVNASIADDVWEGFRDVTSFAAMVSIVGATVHQVLWAQGHKDTCLLLHLALKSSQGGKGPAWPT